MYQARPREKEGWKKKEKDTDNQFLHTNLMTDSHYNDCRTKQLHRWKSHIHPVIVNKCVSCTLACSSANHFLQNLSMCHPCGHHTSCRKCSYFQKQWETQRFVGNLNCFDNPGWHVLWQNCKFTWKDIENLEKIWQDSTETPHSGSGDPDKKAVKLPGWQRPSSLLLSPPKWFPIIPILKRGTFIKKFKYSNTGVNAPEDFVTRNKGEYTVHLSPFLALKLIELSGPSTISLYMFANNATWLDTPIFKFLWKNF